MMFCTVIARWSIRLELKYGKRAHFLFWGGEDFKIVIIFINCRIFIKFGTLFSDTITIEYAHSFPACLMRQLKVCPDGNKSTESDYAGLLCNLHSLGWRDRDAGQKRLLRVYTNLFLILWGAISKLSLCTVQLF